MSKSRFQFRLSDVFSIILAGGFLAAIIVSPDSNWLVVVAVAMLVWPLALLTYRIGLRWRGEHDRP